MKKLSILVLTFAIGFLFTSSSIAKDSPTKGSWAGTLIDKHCGSEMAADKVAGHEKACCMKCAKNGKDLGMIVDGKWYGFDSKGEKLGWAILKKSKASANVQVDVAGTLKGNTIAVSKMTAKA